MVEEIHAIGICRHVVGPFEVKAEGLVGNHAERGALSGEMKFIRPHMQPCRARGLPCFAIPVLDAGDVWSAACVVEAVVVAEVSGLGVLIGIKQQDHPIGIGGWCEGFAGADVEEQMRGVVGDVGGVEVVASSLVRVAACAGDAVVIAVHRVVQVVEIEGLHGGPLREVAGDGDGLRG